MEIQFLQATVKRRGLGLNNNAEARSRRFLMYQPIGCP